MAKLGNFLNVTDIRGKVAGNVYTKGRSGPTMRVRVKPKNPKSATQEVQRGLLTNGTRTAIALDADHIGAWKEAAANITKHQSVSGNAYSPSWITYFNSLFLDFCRANNNAGAGFSTTPPAAPFTPDTIVGVWSSPAAGEIELTFPSANSANVTNMLYIGLMPGTARTPSEKNLRFNSVFAAAIGTLAVTISGLESSKTYAVAYKQALTTTGQTSSLYFFGTITVT